MSYKLTFRYTRNRYNGTLEEINQQIFNELKAKLNTYNIQSTRFYNPSRVSIKVLFPTEKQVNEALDKTEGFKASGFEPKLPMALKAARTVYCSNFDLALFDAYTHTAIKEHLIHAKWNVNNVYIMNSKKSFKIEFKTTKEARKFVNSKKNSIGGIQLHQNTKEMEIDPTVPQCYVCGILHPTHNSNNCPGPKRCLKCNSRDHQFYDCLIPKDINRMSEEQKAQRYCIPCQSIGDHTSLELQEKTRKSRLPQTNKTLN